MREVKKSDLKKVAEILGVELPENCEILVHDLGAAHADAGKAAAVGKTDVLQIKSLGAVASAVSTPDKSALYKGLIQR